MLVNEFIDEKSEQLAFYLESYWLDSVSFQEMERFIWDLLEEWSVISNSEHQMYTHKERVFWHLIYQIQFVGGHSLRHDDTIRDEVQLHTLFLKSGQPCPIDVVGMRNLLLIPMFQCLLNF